MRVRIIREGPYLLSMNWVGPAEWVKGLRYRPRFLGWFVASVCFLLLANTWFLIVLALMGIGIAPFYIGLFAFCLSAISVAAFVYSVTRMRARAESIPEALNGNRRKIFWILFGLFILMFILVNTLTRVYDVPREALTPLAPLLLIILYGIPISTAYDAARLRNTEDRIGIEAEPMPLPAVLMGKSKKKAAIAAITLLSIIVVVGALTSPIAGISTAGSITGIVWFLAWLYPEEE